MNCERCKDPNKTDTHEYTITKSIRGGDDTKHKRIFCAECAQAVKDAGFKLTGGKAPEAKPSEPGPEAREEIPSSERVDVVPEEPEPERPTRRRS